VSEQNIAKSCVKGDYGKKRAYETKKNKAKQSQFAQYFDGSHGQGKKERYNTTDFVL